MILSRFRLPVLKVDNYVIKRGLIGDNEDWREKTNYHKDNWNKSMFGEIRKSVSKVNNPDNSNFWISVTDSVTSKNVKKSVAKRNDDDLDSAIAEATLGISDQRLSRVPNLPVPKKKVTEKVVKKEKVVESELLKIGFDNPFKKVLTPEVMSKLDPNQVRENLLALKKSGKRQTGEVKLPSVTHILNATMPQENRLALQVR